MKDKTSRARILIVEDEVELAEQIRTALSTEGHLAKVELDGTLGLAAILGAKPDLVLLDIMLPEIDGLEIAKQVIDKHGIPIMFMTARDSASDRIRGLSLGADDYIVKPFVMAELLLRVNAVLKRIGVTSPPIQIEGLTISESAGSATVDDEELALTSTEFRLLTELAHSRNRVLSKTYLLSQVWGYDAFDPNLVEVHMSSLRKKLAGAGLPELIRTKRGLGYVISK